MGVYVTFDCGRGFSPGRPSMIVLLCDGIQIDHGDRLVERLLALRETYRLHGRRLHDYLTAAITADLNGQSIPALLAPP